MVKKKLEDTIAKFGAGIIGASLIYLGTKFPDTLAGESNNFLLNTSSLAMLTGGAYLLKKTYDLSNNVKKFIPKALMLGCLTLPFLGYGMSELSENKTREYLNSMENKHLAYLKAKNADDKFSDPMILFGNYLCGGNGIKRGSKEFMEINHEYK